MRRLNETRWLFAEVCLLSSIVDFHHLRFAEHKSACEEAAKISQMAKEHNLHVFSLMQLASAYVDKDPSSALKIYQQATPFIDVVSSLIRSKWWMELAIVHARCGDEGDALNCIQQSHACHPSLEEIEGDHKDNAFLYADYAPRLSLWEGMAYLHLGYLARDHQHPEKARVYYQQALESLANIDIPISNRFLIAGRVRVKTFNQQAEVALALEDPDAFCRYLKEAARAARKLCSPLLSQETWTLLHNATTRWPDNLQVKALAMILEQSA